MATLDELTVLSAELYGLMVDAHKQAAEVAAFHSQETLRWLAAGKPVRPGMRGEQVADGFMVLRPMTASDLDRYLKRQMLAIRFVGMSVDATITISQAQYEQYAVPKYRFKEATNG
jgi:hypothetical protein